VPLTDDHGGPQALVGMRGRHLDADQGDVGAGALHERQQPSGILRFTQHLESAVGEQPRQARA